MNPQLFLAARQNRPTSAALFKAMRVDALLVPTEVVAHEVYAQISTPMLWRFIQGMPAMGDEWAAEFLQRLRHNCGRELPALWKIRLDAGAGAGARSLARRRRVVLQDLLRSPEDRSRQLRVVPLLLLRGAEAILTPDGDDGAGARTTSCCSPVRDRRGASSRAPWWSTRRRRTCCSTSTSRRAGCGASCPGRTSPGSRSDAAASHRLELGKQGLQRRLIRTHERIGIGSGLQRVEQSRRSGVRGRQMATQHDRRVKVTQRL